METRPRVPDPEPEELAHGARVRQLIVDAIRAAGGRLSFEAFMDLALFAPGLGYYVAGARKFGRDGDFVTAPEVSPLFGAALARQCAEILAATGGGIVEFGGGTGRLAASLLPELARLGVRPARYLIVELSPELRARQRETLRELAPAEAGCVEWLCDAPPAPLDGVVLANEVLDALPVRVFARRDGVSLERGVGLDRAGGLGWTEWPADATLEHAIARCFEPAPPPADYRSEVNLRQRLWIADLPRFLRRGVALLVDYGDARRERYHPSRADGSLRCYRRHRVHDDVLWAPGLQDITASVDFTAVAEDAHAAGLAVLGYATQAGFLLACGLDDLLRGRAADPAVAARDALQARVLLLPSEMGTRCKVIALGRGFDGPLRGFALRDERHRL
jgi:SAM-dependent MidA family methyltransferase